MIPAFYHFTFLSLQPKKQSPPKTSILCFFKVLSDQNKILEAATSDTESYFPTGTKRLIIRTLKSEMWRKSPWTCFIPFQCFIIVETNKEF